LFPRPPPPRLKVEVAGLLKTLPPDPNPPTLVVFPLPNELPKAAPVVAGELVVFPKDPKPPVDAVFALPNPPVPLPNPPSPVPAGFWPNELNVLPAAGVVVFEVVVPRPPNVGLFS
jgi:hypothetical protein